MPQRVKICPMVLTEFSTKLALSFTIAEGVFIWKVKLVASMYQLKKEMIERPDLLHSNTVVQLTTPFV